MVGLEEAEVLVPKLHVQDMEVMGVVVKDQYQLKCPHIMVILILEAEVVELITNRLLPGAVVQE